MATNKKRRWSLWAVVAFVIFLIVLCAATGKAIFGGSAKVPSEFVEKGTLPSIYPDYVGVTVPLNIAPLHFHIDHDSTYTDFVTRFTAGAETWNIGGEDVRPGLKKWNEMKSAALAADCRIAVEVFQKQGDTWHRQKPFDRLQGQHRSLHQLPPHLALLRHL